MNNLGNTQYIDHTTGKKIELRFPKKLLQNEILREDINTEHLNHEDVTRLFTKLVNGWLNGNIATEELSSLANFLLAKLKNKDSQLAARLMDASELSYYVRKPSKESGQPLYGFVARLREFAKERPSD